MGRKLTVTLAIALLTFVLAPLARADQITTPTGILIIPDGSHVTSLFPIPGFGCGLFALAIDFKFQSGTGNTGGCFNQGEFTNITFTSPVTDLSLAALVVGNDGELSADGFLVFQCSFFASPCPENGMLNLTLNGPISSLFLGSTTFSGIESLSFAVDAGDPPTSSLILLGFGLIGLLVSSRRKVPVCP